MSAPVISTLLLMVLIVMQALAVVTATVSLPLNSSNTTNYDSLPLLTIKEEAAIARWVIHHHRSGVLKKLKGMVTYELMITSHQNMSLFVWLMLSDHQTVLSFYRGMLSLYSRCSLHRNHHHLIIIIIAI